MSRGKKRSRRNRIESKRARNTKLVLLGLVAMCVAGLSVFAVSNSATPVSATATPRPIPTYGTEVVVEPTAAFLGDSYTHGTGASSEATRWTTLTADAEGWTELNVGLGGTGYATSSGLNGCGRDYCSTYVERVQEIVAAAPTTVIVAGGQNDRAALMDDPDAVKAAVDQTFAGIRAGLPNAAIVAVGPSTPGTPSKDMLELDSWVHAAADAVGATYISLLDPAVIDASMLAPDGGHVLDVGHQAIADRVIAALPPV